MLEALRGALKLEDLRRRIIFTLLMLLVFRIGAHVPVPGLDASVMEKLFKGQLFGFFDVVSGGAFRRLSIFAMSITPYINASIIMQLLTVVIPRLEQVAKEGEEGRKKITQYTRYGTVILGFIQALGLAYTLKRSAALTINTVPAMLLIALTLTAGTAFLMWLGERITEKGIGNGISLLIFAGIVSRIPAGAVQIFNLLKAGSINIFSVLLFLVIAVLVIAAVVFVTEGQRKIPVQYAKRVVGRRVYGGQSTHIPIRVNSAGVIPVIFASSVLLFPSTIATYFPTSKFALAVNTYLSWRSPLYIILQFLLIIFFTYFYTAIIFNPVDVAENIKKYGGFIPGIRPGKATAEYLEKVLSRLTLAGGIFLGLVATLPNFMIYATGIEVAAGFGGTALLIVVGVVLETMKQMEAHLLMRHYQGFIK